MDKSQHEPQHETWVVQNAISVCGNPLVCGSSVCYICVQPINKCMSSFRVESLVTWPDSRRTSTFRVLEDAEHKARLSKQRSGVTFSQVVWRTVSSDVTEESGVFVTTRRILLMFAFVFSMLMASVPTAQVRGNAQSSDSGKTINLELIVDSSGSMAAETDTGNLRIDSAKTVLTEVISTIPEVEGVNVGFRVYGHEGDNTEEGRAESCRSSELLVPMDGVDVPALTEQVNELQPVGWTPLGFSLEEAAKDFEEPASDDVVNAIVMVTDGLETCDADPVAIASELRASDAGIITHVIGFGTKPEELDILSGIAEAGDGQLLGSNNAGQLMSALFDILEDLQVVEETGTGEARDSPLGIGRIGTVGDYEVSVLSVTPNADEIVTADGFSEPPTAGNQYFMARVGVTYVGSTAGNPAYELNPQAVGALSTSYTQFNNMCGYNSFEDSFFLGTELFEGGSAEYNLCWQIDSEDADSLVMYTDSNVDFNADPVWFSLGNPIEKTIDPNSTPAIADEANDDPTPTEPKAESSNDRSSTPLESSRKTPLPMGEVGTVGDYEVSVLDVKPDADEIVTADGFSEPPTPGNQYFMVRVAVTYVGSTAGNPAYELDPQAVGALSTSYTLFNNMCGFGSFEDALFLATELFEGGSGEYNVCWQIDSEDAESLVMYIESNADFNADPVWFSLQS